MRRCNHYWPMQANKGIIKLELNHYNSIPAFNSELIAIKLEPKLKEEQDGKRLEYPPEDDSQKLPQPAINS
jgi:hypothetical protein